MARSSTFVVHVGYHCCIAFMKSRAGSVLRTEGGRGKEWMDDDDENMPPKVQKEE